LAAEALVGAGGRRKPNLIVLVGVLNHDRPRSTFRSPSVGTLYGRVVAVPPLVRQRNRCSSKI
jgi:hypothetical protein